VYRAWQQYERAKGKGWDRADLSAHLYRQLMTTGGYLGARFEAIYRDEVQDFTQVRRAIWTCQCTLPNLHQPASCRIFNTQPNRGLCRASPCLVRC
jgi:hypothetical protein